MPPAQPVRAENLGSRKAGVYEPWDRGPVPIHRIQPPAADSGATPGGLALLRGAGGARYTPAMAYDARVILTAYNQLHFLRRVLRGYLRQSHTHYAITVADDGSKDGTDAFIQSMVEPFAERGIRLEHIWQEDDGWRKCRILNRAVAQAPDEPLLIFSDGDCIPPRDYIATHVEAHVPRSFHVAGGVRLSKEVSETITEADVDSGHFETLAEEVHHKDARRRYRKSKWGTLVRRRRRPKILGLNFAVDRSLFVAVNGFDENFRSYALEDSDIRDRLMRLRPRPIIRNMYGTNEVFHLWHPSSDPTRGRKTQWDYYTSKRPIACENGYAQHVEG